MSAVLAMSATAILFGQTVTTTPSTGAVALTANTLLVMGGNGNPDAVNMEKELNNRFTGKDGTPYPGYVFTPVKWSAQTPISTGADGTLFNVSQDEGLQKIDAALAKTYVPGQKVVIVGYSSSASVVSRQINALQATRNTGAAGVASTPSTEDLSFVVFGNPMRPNGGFFTRYPGYKIGPPLGVDFQPPLGASDYKITDVCRQYDGFCDYPTNPTNMLVMINTALGMYFDHGDYFNVDIDNKDNILRDQTVGNTRFITVKNTLPILRFMPSFLAAPLDAILRPQIEAAYDRTGSLGTPTPSTVSAANDPLLNLVNTYLRLFGGSGSGTQTPVESTPNTVTKQVSARKVVTSPTEETPALTAPSTSTASTPTGDASTTSSPAPTSATTSSTVPEGSDPTTSTVPTSTSTPSTSSAPSTITNTVSPAA
ncbi:MAG: PE-PPE domain-containing protein [Corynebacteriales bacterium]|uniref:PE-PPE domain-containing protein n=1 Tax=Williamsia herbipolensis TaxID=1603258 RepID=A0AAU4K1B1_9NOCA|nr:PE-PPE domain-containing protein [Williamsia herbipolensis]MCX6468052.1 PE-PPE domain-containing protein [Mycobacteriales bacterium]